MNQPTPSNPYSLDEQAFQTWLDQKHPQDTIGVVADACGCVLATFLHETYDHTFQVQVDDHIDESNYECLSDEKVAPLPVWAWDIATNFDMIDCMGMSITKEEYLQRMPS
jgi:hypothetical protein